MASAPEARVVNNHQRMVETFMKSFGQDVPNKPTLALDAPAPFPFELRANLIDEEAREYVDASDGQDMVEMIDALCDILYVTYGAASAMGIDLEPFFAEVHRTNMAKLGPDGKPILREDGKGLKPPGWTPPDIAGILKRVTEDTG